MRPITFVRSLALVLFISIPFSTSFAGGKPCKDDKKCRPKEVKPAPKPANVKTRPMMKPKKLARSTAGVSVGGAQDIGYARKQIKQGNIPSPESFTPEGLFSEHDFALATQESCETLFCLRPDAAEVNILSENNPWILLQLGLDSGIELSSFQRKPQNLVVVLDRSGSMSGDKIVAARDALTKLVDLMTPKDRLSVVLFDDRVDVLFQSVKMEKSQKSKIRKLIDTIEARGSTDIDSGLQEGFDIAKMYAGKKGISDRVLLFTDAMPNVGPTGKGHFASLAKKYGKQDIGLTIFGVGIDFGYAIAETTSAVRGANYVFLEDADKLAKVFEEDFDFLVTPIAHEFSLEIETAPGYTLGETFGVPGPKNNKSQVKVATLFLSKEKGTIAVQIKKDLLKKAGKDLAYIALSYQPINGSRVHESTKVQLSLDAGPGVRKVAALVSMARTLKDVIKHYQTPSKESAENPEKTLSLLAKLLRDEAKSLQDESLRKEAGLVEDLKKNISKRTRVSDNNIFP